jgi:adenosylhomocysteinase
VEIEIEELEKMASKKKRVRSNVDQYTLKNGRRINLLGEGRLINLAAAEGHPAAVMDMSFANQSLAAEYMVKQHGSLKNEVIPVPERIDREIARLKLVSMGYKIDTLTDQQARYLASWEQGT